MFLKTLITGIRSLEENDSRKAAREKSVQRVYNERRLEDVERDEKGRPSYIPRTVSRADPERVGFSISLYAA